MAEQPGTQKILKRNVAIYGLASILGGVFHGSHIVWSHFLPPEDAGRFGNLQVLFSLCLAVVGLQAHHWARVQYPRSDSLKLGRLIKGFAIYFLGAGVTLALVLALTYPLLERWIGSGIAIWYVLGIVVACVLSSFRILVMGIAEARQEPGRASAWSELVEGLRPGAAVLWAVVLGATWRARWFGLVLVHAVSGLLAMRWLRVHQLWRGRPAASELRSTLAFALPLGGVSAAYFVYDGIDRWLLTSMVGLEAAGRYDVAYRVAMIVQTVIMVSRRSFASLYHGLVAQRKLEEAHALLRATLVRTVVLCALVTLSLPLILLAVPLLGRGYQSAWGVVPIVATGLTVNGAFSIWSTTIIAQRRTALLLALYVFGACVNVIGNLYLIPVWSEIGAAVATLLSFVSMFGAMVLLRRLVLKEPVAHQPEE